MTFQDAVWGNCFWSSNSTSCEPHQNLLCKGMQSLTFDRFWMKTDQYVYLQHAASGKSISSAWMTVSLCTSHIRKMTGNKVNESEMLHLSIPLCHDRSFCTDGDETSSSQKRHLLHDLKKDKNWHRYADDSKRNFTHHFMFLHIRYTVKWFKSIYGLLLYTGIQWIYVRLILESGPLGAALRVPYCLQTSAHEDSLNHTDETETETKLTSSLNRRGSPVKRQSKSHRS